MRQSIRFKITFTLTVIIVTTIFLIWFMNRAFLPWYYKETKIKALDDVYEKIVDIYKNSTSTGYLSDTDTQLMERLTAKYNVEIGVLNQNFTIIYPSYENVGKSSTDYLKLLMGYMFFGSYPSMQNITKLKETDNYSIYSLYDSHRDTNYIDLIGSFHNPVVNIIDYNNIGNNNTNTGKKNQSTTDNTNKNNKAENSQSNTVTGGASKDSNNTESDSTVVDSQKESIIYIRTNFESIVESTKIANEFLSYIGIAVIFIGTLAMFIISNKFTKPILELAGIAKKMTDLDFEVKYKINSKDEIGELGKSINSLSDKLQTTITELKQANNELQTDIQKKTEIDEMRKEFLSNVSHELKTPISLIQGYAEGLKENIHEDEESRDFYCEVIIDEAYKMNQMVKKLLSLNELEFGNNQLNFERFDIITLIKAVLSTTEILFKQKEVTLFFEQAEPVYVWADEYLIEQVVTNYISNALNHVSGRKIIEIQLIPRDDIIRIAVFNTGDNIPVEDLDKLWIKFYKVDKARTREYGGSGIGLSIVKAIMNSHNRECGVINRPVGVEFWFELDTKS